MRSYSVLPREGHIFYFEGKEYLVTGYEWNKFLGECKILLDEIVDCREDTEKNNLKIQEVLL